MKIYRLRSKRNHSKFYSGRRRSFFSRLEHVRMALYHDSRFVPENYELVEYELVEKAKYPAPTRDQITPLTREDVMAIRKEHATKGTIPKELALRYGVSASTVRRIINRDTWWWD